MIIRISIEEEHDKTKSNKEKEIKEIVLGIDKALSIIDRVSPEIESLLDERDIVNSYRTVTKTKDSYLELFELSKKALKVLRSNQ